MLEVGGLLGKWKGVEGLEKGPGEFPGMEWPSAHHRFGPSWSPEVASAAQAAGSPALREPSAVVMSTASRASLA